MLSLAFTGHRKVGGKYELNETLMSNLRHSILKVRAWGFDDFRCGMAVGADMNAAEEALTCGFNLHAYLPFKGYEERWPKAQKDRLETILKQATRIQYVSEPPFYAWKMILRDKVMVQDSSLVLALWDGREEGGTYATITYAKELGIPVWNIYRMDWE